MCDKKNPSFQCCPWTTQTLVAWADLSPRLPTQDNGGPTHTCLPRSNSPAIQSGSNTAATTLSTDQRGLPRLAGGVVDMGAVEAQSQGGPFTRCSTFSSTGLITHLALDTPPTFFCDGPSACRDQCKGNAACARFLVHSCSDPCCTEAGVGYTWATMANSSWVSLANPGGGSYGTLCSETYQNAAATCANASAPADITPRAVLGACARMHGVGARSVLTRWRAQAGALWW